MPDLVFRAATTADVLRLLTFVQARASEDGTSAFVPGVVESALQQLIADPGLGEAWLIEHAGEPAGYIIVTWGFSLEFHGRDAFIDELYVAPSHRGRGIGQRAIEHASNRCGARGIGALHLEVDPENERALALYRRSGFQERGYRLMSRRLSP